MDNRGPEFQYSDSDVKHVGYYKMDNQQIEIIDENQFRKFKPWNGENIDLLNGFSDETCDDFFNQEQHSTLDEILTWIRMNPAHYNLKENNIKFVCQRKILRDFGTFNLNFKSRVKVNGSEFYLHYKVCRYDDIIYISEVPQEEKMNKFSKECCYAGITFGDSRVEEKDDTFSYIVAECRFKDITCLIAGDPDCRDDDGFIEIKTTSTRSFYKYKGWRRGWLQSYLLGNQKLVYGIRPVAEFTLIDVKIENVNDVRRKWGRSEEDTVCEGMLGRIHSVLCELRDNVPEGSTCSFTYKGEGECEFIKNNENVFLDMDYIQYLEDVKQ